MDLDQVITTYTHQQEVYLTLLGQTVALDISEAQQLIERITRDINYIQQGMSNPQ
jgi:hypothetical protein